MNNEALVFTITYSGLIIFVTYIFIMKPIIKRIFKCEGFWIYGTCNNKIARKHSIHKNVQFVLWKEGEQGHKKDYWHNFDSSWWNGFKKDSE